MVNWINNHVNESFEVDTFKSRASILFEARSIIESYDSFSKSIVTIEKDNIVIVRSPNTLAPFSGLGKVVLSFKEFQNWTTIKCEISPYQNATPIILFFTITAMTMWSVIGLLISRSTTSLMVIFSGWIIATGAIVLWIMQSKFLLKRYSKKVVEGLLK